MPARNSVKQFLPDSYYHLYNRGVEKRNIFLDEQDYAVFLSYLKNYLLPKDLPNLKSIAADPEVGWREREKALKLLRMNNFNGNLELIAYCLMPNHFHLLIKQKEANIIDIFTNSLLTRYSMYFNKKYKRVGTLFQDVYKAVLVSTDEQLLHLTRYLHRNPISQGVPLRSYRYSSYPIYLDYKSFEWIKPTEILSFFASTGFNSYQNFVEDSNVEEESVYHIFKLTLDEE